jgi:predicted nucleic acid-binding protein
MVLIYVATNVYLALLLNRINEHGKPLGEKAFRLFARAAHCEFEILLTQKMLQELYGNVEVEKTRMMFEIMKKKLRIVGCTPEDEAKASQMDPRNKGDALHAILAKKHKAKYLVTRNKEHLNRFKGLVEIVYPEEL